MQYQGESDPCTQMSGISRDGLQGLGGSPKQNGVDHRLVAIGEVTDRRWQGEHQVVILDRQQVGLARFEPAMSGATLAPGAMAVTAGVVGDLLMITALAMQHMPAECRTTTCLNRRHHLELAETDMPLMCLTPGCALGAEDVRDLQGLSGHDLSR